MEGLRATASFLHRVIEAEAEAEAVGLGNIVLGGLSQGCATALHVLLSFEPDVREKSALGGFMGMSG